jgi:hypothetical protein
MKTLKTTHGGARSGAGRHKVGRRYIVIRIKEEILDALAPNAAQAIRELVETHYAHLIK